MSTLSIDLIATRPAVVLGADVAKRPSSTPGRHVTFFSAVIRYSTPIVDIDDDYSSVYWLGFFLPLVKVNVTRFFITNCPSEDLLVSC